MGPLCSAALQCLPTYRGEGPASEPEVRATQDYMAEIATRHTVLGALDCEHKHVQISLCSKGRDSADGPRRDRRQGTPTSS